MGIALPPWVVEAHNNVWVLSSYGIIFGIGLPALVVRVQYSLQKFEFRLTFGASQGNWWFGSRRKTKDGIFTQTATNFWKALSETSDVDEVVSALGHATEWETMAPTSSASSSALRALEKNIGSELGPRLVRARQQFKRAIGKLDARWDSLVLLYAHLLRLSIEDPALQKRMSSFNDGQSSSSELFTGQTHVLLQTPGLLNALLNITTARNWSQPSIAAMRLHAYLAQGILPGSPGARWAQLPGMKRGDIRALPATSRDFADIIAHLEEQKNVFSADARKTVERLGRIEIVDAKFKGTLLYVWRNCKCRLTRCSNWRAHRDPTGTSTSNHEAPHFSACSR